MTHFEKMKAMNRALRGEGKFDPEAMKSVLEETHEDTESDGLIVISRVKFPGIEIVDAASKLILV